MMNRPDTLRPALEAFLRAAQKIEGPLDHEHVAELAEFAAFADVARSEGLIELIGISKSDAAGEPVAADAADLWTMYLRQLLARLDPLEDWPAKLEGLYPSFDEAIRAPHADWFALAPLTRFKADTNSYAFANGVVLEPLTDERKESVITGLGRLQSAVLGIWESSWCLTRAFTAPKAGPIGGWDVQLSIDAVITAFRLVRPGAVGAGVHSYTLRGPAFGTMVPSGSNPVSWSSPTPISGPEFELRAEDCQLVDSLLSRLPHIAKHGRVALAAERFRIAYERNRAEDKLIDYWVALEALLLRASEQDELSFRAALRAAWFVGDSALGRLETFTRMRASYKARSQVVHGSTRVARLHDVWQDTEDVLRITLRRGVLRGEPPNLNDLDRAAVAGELRSD